MMDPVIEAINNFFGTPYLTTFIVAMIPLIELKGAIPVGIAGGVPPVLTFCLAYFGSTAVFFALFFLLRPFLELLKKIRWFRRFACKVEYLFRHKAEKIAKKGENSAEKARQIMFFGVFAFVAVPLPMTGVWTGTALAVFLGLKFTDSALAICVGNLIAGLLVLLLSWIFRDYVDYIILGLTAIAAVLLVVFLVKVFRTQLPEESSDSDSGSDS